MKTLSHRQSYIANDLQRAQTAAEQIKSPKPHLLFLLFLLFKRSDTIHYDLPPPTHMKSPAASFYPTEQWEAMGQAHQTSK